MTSLYMLSHQGQWGHEFILVIASSATDAFDIAQVKPVFWRADTLIDLFNFKLIQPKIIWCFEYNDPSYEG